jgi:hypothetical protein
MVEFPSMCLPDPAAQIVGIVGLRGYGYTRQHLSGAQIVEFIADFSSGHMTLTPCRRSSMRTKAAALVQAAMRADAEPGIAALLRYVQDRGVTPRSTSQAGMMPLQSTPTYDAPGPYNRFSGSSKEAARFRRGS